MLKRGEKRGEEMTTSCVCTSVRYYVRGLMIEQFCRILETDYGAVLGQHASLDTQYYIVNRPKHRRAASETQFYCKVPQSFLFPECQLLFYVLLA